MVGRRCHAVEAVPCEDGSPAVAYALGHVAAFVVAVAGAGVVLQQVVQQLAGRVPQGDRWPGADRRCCLPGVCRLFCAATASASSKLPNSSP